MTCKDVRGNGSPGYVGLSIGYAADGMSVQIRWLSRLKSYSDVFLNTE